MCRRIPGVLNVLGIIALFLAFMPYFVGRVGVTSPAMSSYVQSHPSAMPMKDEYKFGWTNSPLIQYTAESELVEDDGGFRVERTQNFHAGFFSLSSLTLVIGLALLWVAKQLRPRVAATPKEQ